MSTVSCNNPPGAVVGDAYSHFFSSSDPDALIYIFPGILPSGLALDQVTGEVSGTPDTLSWTPAQLAAGSQVQSLTVTAFNPGTKEYSDSIICGIGAYLNCLPLTPDCASPPGGAIGVPYSHQIEVSAGGIAPFSFVVTVGALPDGLSMDSSGLITGTPSANGLFSFTVTVTGSGDPLNNVASASCRISIGGATPGNSPQLYFMSFGFLGPLGIGCGAPPEGAIGVAYQQLIPILPSGAAPYTFDIFAGALPDGLSIDPDTGLITGTPTVLGTFDFTVRVTDNDAQTALAECEIVIAEALVIVGAPPTGQQGEFYSYTFTATGGTPPYTFSGDFCAGFGLTVAADGTLSGVALLAGECCFNLTVTDDVGGTTTQEFCILFCPLNGQGV